MYVLALYRPGWAHICPTFSARRANKLLRGAHVPVCEASEPKQVYTSLIYITQVYQPVFILLWAKGQVYLPTSIRRLCSMADVTVGCSPSTVSLGNGEGEMQCLCRAAPRSQSPWQLAWSESRLQEESVHFHLHVSESHTTAGELPVRSSLKQEKTQVYQAIACRYQWYCLLQDAGDSNSGASGKKKFQSTDWHLSFWALRLSFCPWQLCLHLLKKGLVCTIKNLYFTRSRRNQCL